MNQLPNVPSIPPKTTERQYTIADVGMRIARDVPMYMVVALIGILAFKEKANAMEAINGIAIALLAKTLPTEYLDKLTKGTHIIPLGVGVTLLAHYIA